MLLGVLIVISPWFPFQPERDVMDADRSIMILNIFVVGMLVLASPSSNMSRCNAGRRWRKSRSASR